MNMDSHLCQPAAELDTNQALVWLSASCAGLFVVTLLTFMQADDPRAEDEARAWARGYQAGVEYGKPSVGDAYRQGVHDCTARVEAKLEGKQ